MKLEQESLSSLACEIVKDSQKLLSLEVSIIAAEISDVLSTMRLQLIFLFWQGVAVLLALLLSSLAAVHLMNRYIELSLWSCYGIVAVVFILLACGLALKSKKVQNA